MVGILVSFSDGLFSGATLVSGSVRTFSFSYVAHLVVQHFEVFDFHLSLLSTVPGTMAQMSPKLTLRVVDVGIV